MMSEAGDDLEVEAYFAGVVSNVRNMLHRGATNRDRICQAAERSIRYDIFNS